MSVTNLEVAEGKETVFASSASYNAQIPMAGREDESKTLVETIADGGTSRIVTISAGLGSGKTFFLSSVLGKLTADPTTAFDEQRDAVTLMANKHFKDPENIRADPHLAPSAALLASVDELAGGAQVLVVEELDRKTDFGPLIGAVRASVRWAHEGKGRTLILTGDRFLEHLAVREELENADNQVTPIELEPLGRGLLAHALELRLAQHLKRLNVGDDIREAVRGLFAEPAVSDGLLPNTTVPVTTFRQSLEALREMARTLPLDQKPCRLDVNALRPWQSNALPASGLALELEEAIFAETVRRYGNSEPFSPIDEQGLITLVGDVLRGEDWEYEDQEYYHEEAICPLVRSGVLLPTGIPFEGGATEQHRISGPYMPTAYLVLRVMASVHLSKTQ